MKRSSPGNRRRGSAMVEFALSATLLTSVFLGVFQFGYSLYQYNELVNAVRAGARFASLQKISNSGNGVVGTDYADAVRNMVVFGTPNGGGAPVVPGLTTGNVQVQVGFDTRFVPRSVTVRITSYQINAVVRTFTITNKPALTMPFFGQYCPTGC